MKQLLILAFSFVLFTGLAFCKKGRIVGGSVVPLIELHPYQVSLSNPLDGHYCGGAIISPFHILTAAHCVVPYRKNSVIYTGSAHANAGDVHHIVEISTHSNYVGAETFWAYDIAIIKLQNPIIYNARQLPVKLPLRPVQSNDLATIAGWGYLKQNETSTSSILRVARMRMHSGEECKTKHDSDINPEVQICAFNSFGVGACQGDSGGPLVGQDGRVYGITSWVRGCGKGHRDVYTNVFRFRNWIERILYHS
ncbi:hypothetical protein TKK_0010883 [Trichogramma kaykai]|uniref:Peptidase S1 domain-containing protein n=1 Tax=Trichogramma kaykai TaxID=54128 RepID=A0ABD2WUZ2_9HYME